VPDGLSSVGVTARLDNGSVADLAAVRPGAVGVENGTASGFTIDARSRDSVTLTASDVGDAVGPGEGPVTVARLTANGTTAGETDLNVTVGSVTDDAGTGVATGAHDGVVRVRSGPVALFPNGVPGGTTDRPPTDVDGDGTFEDLDGDGQFTFVDVIEFVFAIDTLVGTDLSQAQTAALDHSDDGAVGFTDVVDLVFQL
jgi:PKD repeat protein